MAVGELQKETDERLEEGRQETDQRTSVLVGGLGTSRDDGNANICSGGKVMKKQRARQSRSLSMRWLHVS